MVIARKSIVLSVPNIILHDVVGAEQIQLTIFVDVGSNSPPSLAKKLGNAGFLRNVAERPVAVIVEQRRACGGGKGAQLPPRTRGAMQTGSSGNQRGGPPE